MNYCVTYRVNKKMVRLHQSECVNCRANGMGNVPRFSTFDAAQRYMDQRFERVENRAVCPACLPLRLRADVAH